MTSAALAMFVAHAQAQYRGGGRLYLAAAQDKVQEILTRAGFTGIFPISATVDEAIKLIKQSE
jgi:anti-anti-sigma factor